MKKMILFLLFTTMLIAQQPLIDPQVFAQRREAFMKKMDPKSLAIFVSPPVTVRNGDVDFEYRQDSNLYYLTGFEEPECVVVMNPGSPKHKFVLFIHQVPERRQLFEGAPAGIEQAMKIFHADTAYFTDDFDKMFYRLTWNINNIYYTFGINPENDLKFIKQSGYLKHFGQWKLIDPVPILGEMRLIKNDGDWSTGLKKAIDISAQAHLEAFKSIEPGMWEFEIQGVFELIYRKNGSPRNGYPCIIGSGPNSCTLHYDKNNRKMLDGDMVLMDCAAEYGYYSADITRTVPVNGRFSKEQRDIYQIVLDAQNAAMKNIKPGVIHEDVDKIIDDVLASGLFKLGFIKDKKDFRVFTIHGYMHWIGMEVHDVGLYTIDEKSRTFEPGMVTTIEPGIYIRADAIDRLKATGYSDEDLKKIKPLVQKYLNIGVRIEDDVLVTKNGITNLSAAVPREIDDIEKLMKEKGIGNMK